MKSLIAFIALIIAGPAFAETMTTGKAWPTTPVISAPGINGAARFTKSADSVTIGPVVITDAFRAVETDTGVVVRNLRISGLTARGLQRDGIRLREAYDTTISGFNLTMRAQPQTGQNLPEGIAIYAGSGIVIEDGAVSGFRMAVVPGVYTNGDGIATEPKSSGIIRRVVSSFNSDGGFDLKGRWRLDDLTATGNGSGYRLWTAIEAGTLTAINNGKAIHLAPGAVVTIDKLVARSSKPAHVIVTEGRGTLTIGSCDLTGMAPGSTLVQRNGPGAVLTLGPGCKL